jgi:hypothetical protein
LLQSKIIIDLLLKFQLLFFLFLNKTIITRFSSYRALAFAKIFYLKFSLIIFLNYSVSFWNWLCTWVTSVWIFPLKYLARACSFSWFEWCSS